ncbi:MAG TPA: lipoyl synthase, partial [Candidatus Thermoplasmatota archaeon]|nr:lipoyl synthase [Candidatus Thermoplasmatota archaeon]
NLHTVCEEAHCPNVAECWGGGTATFMLMGDTCTRGCRFCAVTSGKPGALDPMEPLKISRAIAELKLKYAVITSVDRDDLPDGGAHHFASTIRTAKSLHPEGLIEVLIPDFQGDEAAIRKIIEAKPDVIAHNVETVRRLTPGVRDRRATYDQTLEVHRFVKRENPKQYTKSSIMLGLGETDEELEECFRDLRAAGVDVLTLGQYLRPSAWHLPVQEYVPPARFEDLKTRAEGHGFLYVASGPLVRSSYKAAEFFVEGLLRQAKGAPPAAGLG